VREELRGRSLPIDEATIDAIHNVVNAALETNDVFNEF
jgi:hypothetical protein